MTEDCQKAKQIFTQLQSAWEDFKFELTQVENLLNIETTRHRQTDIKKFILEIETIIDPNKLELRKQLAEKFSFSFVHKPNSAGTMLAEGINKNTSVNIITNAMISKEGDKNKLLIDRKGEVLYSGFDLVYSSREGVMCVFTHGEFQGQGTYHYINEATGEIISSTNKEGEFREGKARRTSVGGEVDFINKNGRTIGGGQFRKAGDFSEGLVWVMPTNNQGYFMNEKGKKKSPNYRALGNFSEGLAAVAKEDGDYYVDKNFVEIAGPFEDMTTFKDGVARVKKGGRWGVIDKTGEVLIGFSYDKITEYSEGRAFASNNENSERVTLLDNKGNIVKIIKGSYIADFSEGFAAMQRIVDGDEVFSFIDKQGKWATDKVFYGIGDFSEGLADVDLEDDWVFINTDFEVEIPGPFAVAHDSGDVLKKGFHFEGGVAEVQAPDEVDVHFIDKKGNKIFEK